MPDRFILKNFCRSCRSHLTVFLLYQSCRLCSFKNTKNRCAGRAGSKNRLFSDVPVCPLPTPYAPEYSFTCGRLLTKIKHRHSDNHCQNRLFSRKRSAKNVPKCWVKVCCICILKISGCELIGIEHGLTVAHILSILEYKCKPVCPVL